MTIDKTMNEVKELQEKDSLTLNEIDNNVKKILKFGTGGAVDLTEVITEIDNNATKLSTIETNICSIDVKLDENSTKTTEISDKIDDLSTNLSEITTKSNTINEKVENIDSNVETIITQTENLTTMNNNITTINSNTATTNNNVSTIKTNVEKITNSLPSGNYNNEVIQKLDEILKTVKQNANEETFTDDPYKLDMEYTGKIEEHRNPTNYDCIEFIGDFETNGYFCSFIADCEDETFSFNVDITYTLQNPTSSIHKFMIAGSFPDQFIDIETGTHTLNITKEDITLKDNKIVFLINTYNKITVHHVKVQLYANNVLIVPKKQKFKVRNAYDKITLIKFENNNAYYKILDKTDALNPSMLNSQYVLGAEKVIDYDYSFNVVSFLNKKYALEPYIMKIDFAQDYYYDFASGHVAGSEKSYPCHSCNLGYFKTDGTSYGTIIGAFSINAVYPYYAYFSGTSESKNRIMFKGKEICASVLVEDLSLFDNTNKTAYIFTTAKGINYLYINNSCNLEIGYGKNVTAYYDKENYNKINVYMNDNDYCVKTVLLLNDTKTGASVVSKKIIGTYDAYFETCSNVYFIEKKGELYMYTK